jgi:hypothetical protein
MAISALAVVQTSLGSFRAAIDAVTAATSLQRPVDVSESIALL